MTRALGTDAFQACFEAVFGPVADAHGMVRPGAVATSGKYSAQTAL